MKKTTRQKGACFEKQARLYLEQQGLQFLAANVFFKCGELDLIMLDQSTVVFIEVRQRSHSHFGSAVESIDYKKQQRWLDSANLWLATHNQSLETANCRFDVIAFGQDSDDIIWIKNFLDD